MGRGRARGVRRLDRPPDQVCPGRLRERRPPARAGRPHARALRMVGLLERDATARLALYFGRRCAGVLPGPRRVRDHAHGGGEHPGQDANPAAGDLRPRAGRADGRGERARADRRRRRRGAALRPEPAGAASLLAVVSVEIVKRYPGFTLDVSWRAEKSVVGLFGPSGAGKTLTLQCLAGLVRPDAGRIVVDDLVVFDAAASVDLPPQARRIGYVFQGYALFPHLTVEENVGFGLRNRSRGERARRSAEVLERLGLVGLERRYPRELSGGQRQRVALGRALAIDPALLLLDEPLSALDAPLRRTLRDELRETLATLRMAAVVVTHDFTEAYRLGDRIVVYEGGHVVQAAPRHELLWQPASESVARIMSIPNVMRGTVVKATT